MQHRCLLFSVNSIYLASFFLFFVLEGSVFSFFFFFFSFFFFVLDGAKLNVCVFNCHPQLTEKKKTPINHHHHYNHLINWSPHLSQSPSRDRLLLPPQPTYPLSQRTTENLTVRKLGAHLKIKWKEGGAKCRVGVCGGRLCNTHTHTHTHKKKKWNDRRVGGE